MASAIALLGLSVMTAAGQASDVRIVDSDGAYTFEIDGEPFVARGAGLEGRDAADVERLAAALAEAGGNAFRTWSPAQAEIALAAAERHGLRVLVGLGVASELSGFDYTDDAAIARQHEAVTAFVDRHRDHPNLLGWLIANEPNLMFGPDGAPRAANPRVYDAVAAIVEHVRSGEPRHPTSIAFAFTPTLVDDVRAALERVPELDAVSFQGYGALPAIPEVATEAAPDRPFLITEFGALGHWEMPATDWGREIEEPSGPKADGVVARMTPAVTDDPTGRLLGSFAFLWGQKQERTPTWYGLFVADPAAGGDTVDSGAGARTDTDAGVDGGADTDTATDVESGTDVDGVVPAAARIATVDELTRIWTGRYPANRAPRATGIVLDDRPATASVRLAPGAAVAARVTLEDADGDALRTRWALRREVTERSDGGLFEATPPALEIASARPATRPGEMTLAFETPDAPGEYRLFAYAYDDRGGVATANIPFLVE